MSEATKTLIIATDGGSRPNPGAGGWAWVTDTGSARYGSFAHTTNNICEFTAMLDALETLKDVPAIEIHYDSQYVWKCITEWGPKWTDSQKKSKKNVELIEKGIKLLQDREDRGFITKSKWVKGHNGHELNEEADELCTTMCKLKKNSVHSRNLSEEVLSWMKETFK